MTSKRQEWEQELEAQVFVKTQMLTFMGLLYVFAICGTGWIGFPLALVAATLFGCWRAPRAVAKAKEILSEKAKADPGFVVIKGGSSSSGSTEKLKAMGLDQETIRYIQSNRPSAKEINDAYSRAKKAVEL